jgi:hypothetical protein
MAVEKSKGSSLLFRRKPAHCICLSGKEWN